MCDLAQQATLIGRVHTPPEVELLLLCVLYVSRYILL